MSKLENIKKVISTEIKDSGRLVARSPSDRLSIGQLITSHGHNLSLFRSQLLPQAFHNVRSIQIPAIRKHSCNNKISPIFFFFLKEKWPKGKTTAKGFTSYSYIKTSDHLH